MTSSNKTLQLVVNAHLFNWLMKTPSIMQRWSQYSRLFFWRANDTWGANNCLLTGNFRFVAITIGYVMSIPTLSLYRYTWVPEPAWNKGLQLEWLKTNHGQTTFVRCGSVYHFFIDKQNITLLTEYNNLVARRRLKLQSRTFMRMWMLPTVSGPLHDKVSNRHLHEHCQIPNDTVAENFELFL